MGASGYKVGFRPAPICVMVGIAPASRGVGDHQGGLRS